MGYISFFFFSCSFGCFLVRKSRDLVSQFMLASLMEFSKHLEFVFRKQRKRKKLSVEFKKEEKFYKDFFFFLIRLSYRYFCAISFWELFAWKVKKREVDFFFFSFNKAFMSCEIGSSWLWKMIVFFVFFKIIFTKLRDTSNYWSKASELWW